MYRKKNFFMVWLVAACLIAIWVSAPAAAETRQEIIEAAKKEGELLFYWSFPGSVQKKIISMYEQKYPFIKVKLFKSDVAVAIVGFCGPQAKKGVKVGTTYISIAYKKNVISKKEVLPGSRKQVRLKASQKALQLLYRTLI